VGGFTGGGQDSSYLQGNQRVGYNTLDPVAGKNEINRLFWQHRNQCPRDHIKLVGHSEGAGLVHVWVTENQRVANANVVLLADPKRWAPGNGGAGIAQYGGFLGYPLAGVDDWFGRFPVLSLCRSDDGICSVGAGPNGYVSGHHGWYDMNAGSYDNTDRGNVTV
jgi:cutinase